MIKENIRIYEILPEEADTIVNTCRPFGLFYVKLAGIYLGIDNSRGDALTEAFSCRNQCKHWLRNHSIQKGE